MILTYQNTKYKSNVSKNVRWEHYLYKPIIKMSIPKNDFKLVEKIQQEYRAILKKETNKEKMDELSKIINKYCIVIPFVFVLGGKFYMYKNEEAKEVVVKNLKDSASFSIANSKMSINYGIN